MDDFVDAMADDKALVVFNCCSRCGTWDEDAVVGCSDSEIEPKSKGSNKL